VRVRAPTNGPAVKEDKMGHAAYLTCPFCDRYPDEEHDDDCPVGVASRQVAALNVRVAELEGQLAGVRSMHQDEMAGVEVLKGDLLTAYMAGRASTGLKARVSELEAQIADLRAKNRGFVDAAETLMAGWKEQAEGWDRFWEAMGCKSVDITVDDAIAKWRELEAEVERLKEGKSDEPRQ
jgi:BMFP domain-containing protein YqiC